MSVRSILSLSKAGFAVSGWLAVVVFHHVANLRKQMAVNTTFALSRLVSCSNDLDWNAKVFCVSYACALFAPASGTGFSFIKVVTSGLVFVACLAMGEAAMMICILPMGDSAKVIWIYTCSIAALMVYLKAIGYVAFEQIIRRLVSASGAFIEVNSAVAFSIFSSSPVPAAGNGIQFKLFNESIKEGSKYGHKKAADPESLNGPYDKATTQNRLLKYLSSHYSEAVQRLKEVLLFSAFKARLKYV